MRIIVCGSRRTALTPYFVVAMLDRFREDHDISLVITGSATGIDTMAMKWAKSRSIAYLGVPALWMIHGSSARPIRNERMITEFQPSLVVVFPGGNGTDNMVETAMKHQIPVVQITKRGFENKRNKS